MRLASHWLRITTLPLFYLDTQREKPCSSRLAPCVAFRSFSAQSSAECAVLLPRPAL